MSGGGRLAGTYDAYKYSSPDSSSLLVSTLYCVFLSSNGFAGEYPFKVFCVFNNKFSPNQNMNYSN